MSEKKELSAKYNPAEVEDKWYAWWTEHKCFHSEPNEKEPYTIVIPPPNVTGILHMGHVLNNTLNDVLIRKAENSAVRLSGGTELPDQRAYWLGRARSVRPNGTKPAGRADGT